VSGAPAEVALDRVIEGDCLEALAGLPGEIADLCYLDPPFNTGAAREMRGGRFEDSWADLGAYLEFLRPRVEQARRMLKASGSILLHVDWRTAHHVRLMLDDVFGAERFVNHLVWAYGLGGSSPRRFARKHDDIFFYAKTAAYFFEPPMVPATSVRMRGLMKKASDVIDIPSINNMSAERTGYPTQKPLALLAMLVSACCPVGGLVIDPFCGSGTTLAAAQATGRRFLGIDASVDAVRVSRERLGAARPCAAESGLRTRRRASCRG
jgi:DNA modification methylase